MKLDAREIQLTADSYFGLRHGLETLSQLWDYDDIHQRFVIPANFTIIDGPEFKHRGVMLDSSRNFIPLDVIKRVIEGMSFNKVRKSYIKVHSVKISWFFYHSDFTWNQFIAFALLDVKNLPLLHI